MNFKKHAYNLSNFLTDELEGANPPLMVGDRTMLYKTFKINCNNTGMWELSFNSDILYSFKLKASALLAAEYYDLRWFNKIKELQLLDKDYYYTVTSLIIMSSQLPNVIDQIKRDILLSRIDNAKIRSSQLRQELKSRFSAKFG